jgi:hypothetical protein
MAKAKPAVPQPSAAEIDSKRIGLYGNQVDIDNVLLPPAKR